MIKLVVLLPFLITIPVSVLVSWLVGRISGTGLDWYRVLAMNVPSMFLTARSLAQKRLVTSMPWTSWIWCLGIMFLIAVVAVVS